MTIEQPAAPAPAPRPASGSSLGKVLLILGGGCLLVILLVAGGCGALVYFGLKEAKNHPLYVDGSAKVKQHPQAQELLGTPIEAGFPSQFHFKSNNNQSTGSVQFGVSGPKGEGTVSVQGTAQGKTWTIDSLQLTSGGKTVDILAPAADTPAPEVE